MSSAGSAVRTAAAALYAAGLLLFSQVLAGTFRRRRNQIYPLVAASACVLVGVHALVDFSLQMPAEAVTFAALLGVGLAQSLHSSERLPAPFRARIRTASPPVSDEAPQVPIPGSAAALRGHAGASGT